MAEYTDITKTGPLTGQQLKQQNNNNYDYPPLKYTPGVGPVTGPILTPEERISIEESYRKKYVVPSGVQLNNNYDISTSEERKKWWEEEGRKKYASRFNDATVTKGYFKNEELEGLYRDMLFKKEFEHLPEYNDLLKLSPDERDSFYAYWRGRINNPITYKIKGKEYPIPGTIKSSEIPYNFSTSPEGREAGTILADLNYYFGQNFDNWSNEERKKFYNEWDVKNWSPYNNSYSKAIEEYPELKPNKQFKLQAEIDNYLKTLYSRYKEAQELTSTIQNLNPKTTTRKWSADTASIFNPAGLDSLAQVTNIASPETIVEEQNKLAEVANKESKARIKEYEKEYLQQHWYSTDKYKQAQEEAEYWNIRGQKRRANSYLTPSNKLLKEAHEYALDKEDEYQISKLPEEEKSKYVTRKEALTKYKEEYIKKSDETPFPLNLGLNSFWRIKGNEDSFPFGFFPFSKERAAEKYAEEKYSREFVKTDKIEPEQNIYASGMSRSQIEQAVQNFSDVYQKFNGSDWMPENEIPYDEIYQETKSLWESGNWREAIYQTDKIIENEVIDPHQSFFKKDNLGNMSSGKAALTQFYTMGVESLVESATAIPSLVVGAIQAFDPDDIQEEGYMNYFDRMLDNALHNDWLGVLSNQNVSDWAAQASEDAIIYGDDFNSLIASGAGTLGAQVGNFLMFAAGGLESRAAKALMRNAVTSTSRSVLRNIVNEGNLAKRQLQLNKAISNSNLFRANYGEAAQQALEGERQIYETYNEKKWELIDSYTPKDLPQLVRQEGDKEVYINDYEFSYTQKEYEEALKHDLNFEAWSLYKQGLGPHPDEDEYEFNKRVSLRAQGIHIFNEKHPNYDDAVELNARRESAVNLGTQTTLLLGFDKLFGGLDKWTLDFAMGRRALKPKDLIGRIKGIKIGDLKPNTSWLKGAWTVAQNPVMETITEVGQQTGSALTKQIAEHNIDSFLENQLYGNGLASWAASSYEGIYNLDKEEFFRDAEIKRTILQTLLTTPLMPVFGGYRNRTSRGQNQSWISRALENIHYYSPIKTTLGEQIYNIGQHDKQINAVIDYINRWGVDPVNQANTRGLIGVQNYTEKMIADLINNDEVAYNNDVFSRTLSEAIMLSNTRETPFAQNRLQWLTNMSQIKSATAEQKAAAIQSMREEATGNSAVRNLSDEQLLDLMETSSKKVLDTYNKVNEIVSSDERFTDGTYNWQQQSALLFNKMAREDLQKRIADKEARIQTVIQSLGEIDLGESKTSKDKVEEGKTKDKKVLLSGRDILALSPVKRAAMLAPQNLKDYSPEQQKIIQETINALNQVDGNILNDIINVGLEEYHLMKIEQDYIFSLQTPGWQSKRVKNKANKIKKAFTSEGNTKAFINKVSQANSVSEIYKSIMSEREANATRDAESIIDVEGVLNSIQDPVLKQRVNEARKIERISNSIKAAIDRTTLTDDIKDDLINQVDRIASEALNSSDVSDISKYNIPITADGQDLSGTLNDILQTATQNASNTQTVESGPVKPIQSSDDLPKPTDLGDRDVDTAIPVNDSPLKRYTLDEVKDRIKKLNDVLRNASSTQDSYQHDNMLVDASIIKDDLEKKLPEGYELQSSSTDNLLEYKLVKAHTQEVASTSKTEDKRDDITDIDNRREETKQPIDRDGITKVAEILFEKEGRVYSYPIRNEDVQLGDGVNGPFSGTGRVINIRDVQDDAEAEFLIYQTDKKGNFKINNKGERIKRERPQFIDRHSQIQSNSTEEHVIYEDDKVRNSISTETKDGITTTKVTTFRKDKNKNTTFGATPINSDVVAQEYRETYETEDVEKVEYYIEEVREDSDGNIGGTIGVKITYKDGTTSTTNHIVAKLNYNPFKQQTTTPPTENSPITGSTNNELITIPYTAKGQPTRQYTVKDNIIYNEKGEEVFSTPSKDRNKILANAAIRLKQAVVVDFENAQYVVHLNGDIISVTTGKKMEWPQNHGFRKNIIGEANKKFAEINQNQSVYEPKTISSRTELQQNVINNNITPGVIELDGTALAKGLFEPNKATGQPNIMRQLQEEGAFDYMNKGALTEGDEIEFIVTQEQMPDGSTQVVIWEVTEPKDDVERTNPKWHGKQLLNVLDQTEVGGKRKELIDRIRTAYEKAGRPESFLYNTETFTVDKISHSTVPFRQTNPTEASSDETIETTNLQKGLVKKNGVWGISFFNKAKGKMVHVPVIFRQAKKDKSGSTRILFSDSRMKSKTIDIQKINVGKTGDVTDITMIVPTPKGFSSTHSVYVLTKNLPNSSDKYKESIRTGSIGKALIEKIKNHLNDIKTVTAFSDYLGFRRGFSEYIYNDRNRGRIDLGYRGSTGNTVLVSAIPYNNKYVLVDPTDARNILNDNNGQGFTLDEVCKEYLSQLVDSPEADVTMRLNMEAIENNPSIITDLIDDGLLWAPNSLNAKFTAANTQFSCSLDDKAKPIETKKETASKQESKETPKPAPVVSNNNPSTTTTNVSKIKPKVEDNVELGSKVKRRKLKVGQSTQVRPEVPTTPISTLTTTSTNTSSIRPFETLSEKDKQHILTKVNKEEWDNLTKEEQNNILNC